PTIAFSEAIRMSQEATSASPPPRAGPLIAQITGTEHSRIALNASRAARECAHMLPGRGACCPSKEAERAFMSAPAQKHLPAPVKIATRTSGRLLSASNAAWISSITCRFTALTGGRSMVTVAMESLMSVLMTSGSIGKSPQSIESIESVEFIGSGGSVEAVKLKAEISVTKLRTVSRLYGPYRLYECYKPCELYRNNARSITMRCTSDGPSPIRRTRASRYQRSRGN